MTDLAKSLLEYMEKLGAEMTADPKGYELRLKQSRAEALDKIVETLNKIGGLLAALDDHPEEFTDLDDLGGIEGIRAKLLQEQADYNEYYRLFSASDELPSYDDVQAAIEATKKEVAEAEAEGYVTITGAEYKDLVSRAIDGDHVAIARLEEYPEYEDDVELEQQTRQTNKELLEVLSGNKGKEAEALLLTATLDDYAAAGINLTTWQRDTILSGAAEPIKGIIYGLLFTQLLKLWRAVTESREDQPGSLKLTPYALTKPQTTAISVSKAANKIITIAENGEQGTTTLLDVGRRGKDVIEISAIMKYDDKNVTLLGRPLKDLDRTVHDAVAAIYAAGNAAFTWQDLYRACNGWDITNIADEQLEPYVESVEQSRTRLLRIDATDQIQAYYKGKIKKVVYENYFLPLKAVEVTTTNGTMLKGYAFLDAPPLYEYSSNIRQVVSVPVGLLRAGKSLRQTPEVATITNYLIKRIDGIKNPKNALQNKIAYDAIFEAAGIDTSRLDRTQLKRKRDIVKAKLDYFKLQGFIKDYTEYKNGRQAGGVEIIIT